MELAVSPVQGNAAARQARRIRILIDARKIFDGGIGTYTQNLIEGLLEIDRDELTVLMKPGEARSFFWKKDVQVIEDGSAPYSLDELLFLGRRLRGEDYDVFHEPHFTLPFNVSCSRVVTVHDLMHVYSPERSYYPILATPLIRSALRRASRIVAVSESTRVDLERLLGKASSVMKKVVVIPNVVDPYYRSRKPKKEVVEQRFKLRGKYILAIYSNLKPHKGLEDLLRAFNALLSSPNCRNGLSDVKLVLAGKGTEELVAVERLLDTVGSTKGVLAVGGVTKEELFNLYSFANAVAIASTAEGFCLPALEARTVGTPVVARPVPAVLELLSANDICCRDFSIEALTAGLREALMRERNGADHRAAADLERYQRETVIRKVRDMYLELV